jgi:hypothetical protein
MEPKPKAGILIRVPSANQLIHTDESDHAEGTPSLFSKENQISDSGHGGVVSGRVWPIPGSVSRQ